MTFSLYNFRRKYRSVSDTCPLERYVSERFLPESVEHELWVTTRGKRAGVPLYCRGEGRCAREAPVGLGRTHRVDMGAPDADARMRAEYAAQRAFICSEGVMTSRHSVNAEPPR